VQGAGIALDSSHVYWVNPDSNTIGRANLDGTGVNQSFIDITCDFGCLDPQGVAVDAGHIYWATFFGGGLGAGIGRANLDGTGVNPKFIDTNANTGGVAVDPEHIYWTDLSNNRIAQANLNGTGVNGSLISTPVSPVGVAVGALG
jgi:hypothetical protein